MVTPASVPCGRLLAGIRRVAKRLVASFTEQPDPQGAAGDHGSVGDCRKFPNCKHVCPCGCLRPLERGDQAIRDSIKLQRFAGWAPLVLALVTVATVLWMLNIGVDTDQLGKSLAYAVPLLTLAGASIIGAMPTLAVCATRMDNLIRNAHRAAEPTQPRRSCPSRS